MVALIDAAHKLGADERTLRRAVAAGTVRCHERSPRRRRLDDELAYLSGHWELLSNLRRALRTEPEIARRAASDHAERCRRAREAIRELLADDD